MKTSSFRLIATLAAALIALQAGSADAEVITALVNESITVNSSNQSPSFGLYAGGYEVAAIDGNFGTSSYAFFELDAETGSGAEAVDDPNGRAAAVLSGGTTISGSSNFGNGPYILRIRRGITSRFRARHSDRSSNSLVPMLCVGMPSWTLRVLFATPENERPE